MKNFAYAIAAHRNEVLPQLCGSDIAARDDRGRTLLLVAAHAGNREAVKFLLDAGADAEAEDNDGNTALHLAAETGGHVADLLLEAGAGAYALNKRCETPLVHALRLQRERAVSLIPLLTAYRQKRVPSEGGPDGDGVPVALLIARGGRAEELTLLSKGGRETHETDAEGNTTLHIAAHKGLTEYVRGLLKFGIHPNACNQHNETPLHLAVRGHHAEIVGLLLSAGANPNIKDAGMHTPLSIAVVHQQFNIAAQLVEAGADVAERFPGKKIDTMFYPDLVYKRHAYSPDNRQLTEAFMRAYFGYLQEQGERFFDYLYLAILCQEREFARLLIRRDPTLLPQELEEAYYNYVSATDIRD